MTSIRQHLSRERGQYLVLAALSIGAVGLSAILQASDPLLFRRFIGRTHPLIAVPLVSASGVVLLSLLLSRGWFAICRREHLGWLWRSAGLGALFGLVAVGLDLRVVFPADLNVAFPASLLFYPVIGFVAEVVFHLVPLAILRYALVPVAGTIGHRRTTVIAMAMVSLLEPVYQTIPMAASPHYPVWSVVFLWLHLLLFNLFQFVMFWRYDFLTMYAARLGYYLVWHVVWGQLRLQMLF
jgi:hypothetical protein